MGLFNKRKDEIPTADITLPNLPEVSNIDLPSIDKLDDHSMLPSMDNSNLPSLPGHGANDPIDQNKIKSVINQPPQIKKPIDDVPDIHGGEYEPSKFEIVESSARETPIKIGHEEARNSSLFPKDKKPAIKNYSKENKPVYVRLDKFQTTIEAFEEIREKILDIEKILNKIKEVREKEESELEEWENEIQMIKSRIESVDKNIFDKIN